MLQYLSRELLKNRSYRFLVLQVRGLIFQQPFRPTLDFPSLPMSTIVKRSLPSPSPGLALALSKPDRHTLHILKSPSSRPKLSLATLLCPRDSSHSRKQTPFKPHHCRGSSSPEFDRENSGLRRKLPCPPRFKAIIWPA